MRTRASVCERKTIDAAHNWTPGCGSSPDCDIDDVGIVRVDYKCAEQRGGEDIAQQIFPVSAGIDRLENATVRSACGCVENVRIVWIQRQTLAEDGQTGEVISKRRPSRPSRVSGKIIRGLPDPAASEYRSSAHIGADVHYVGVPRVAHGNIDAAGHNRATVSGNVKEARGAEGRPNG